MNTTPTFILHFFVPGTPIPKQSFQLGARGQGYTKEQVREWERSIHILAANAMQLQDQDATSLPVRLTVEFILPDRQRRDIDNLTKGLLDGMKGAVFTDDDLVVELNARKVYLDEMPTDPGCTAGVSVYVHER